MKHKNKTCRIEFGKYNSENTSREIHMETQIGKYNSVKYNSGNTNRKYKSEDTSLENTNRTIQTGKYKSEEYKSEHTYRTNTSRENTNGKRQVGEIQVGTIQIGKYKVGNTDRKIPVRKSLIIQIGNQSKNTKRKNKNREIYVGKYRQENTSQDMHIGKRKSEKTSRKSGQLRIQFSKMQIGKYKSVNTNRKKYRSGSTSRTNANRKYKPEMQIEPIHTRKYNSGK